MNNVFLNTKCVIFDCTSVALLKQMIEDIGANDIVTINTICGALILNLVLIISRQISTKMSVKAEIKRFRP